MIPCNGHSRNAHASQHRNTETRWRALHFPRNRSTLTKEDEYTCLMDKAAGSNLGRSPGFCAPSFRPTKIRSCRDPPSPSLSSVRGRELSIVPSRATGVFENSCHVTGAVSFSSPRHSCVLSKAMRTRGGSRVCVGSHGGRQRYQPRARLWRRGAGADSREANEVSPLVSSVADV